MKTVGGNGSPQGERAEECEIQSQRGLEGARSPPDHVGGCAV